MKFVLLLTGCVNPNGMALTALKDVDERKNQYIKALEWYIENTFYDIVFVENTGFDMGPFFEDSTKSGRLECLTFQGNDYDKSLGKGYGEALILKYALENSQKISNADLIVKITGRLIVKNINVIINECSDERSLYVKEFYLQRLWFVSYFFIAPRSYYQLFVKNYKCLNDSEGYYFEHLMCDISREWTACGHRVREIFHPLIVRGQSGSTGSNYKTGFLFAAKSYIKYFLHKLGYHRI